MDASLRTRHIFGGRSAIVGTQAEACATRGFTLVEMLVALIVGLLVLIGVHQVFVAGVTTQTTASSQMEVDRKAQVAMDEIVRNLRQAAPSIVTLSPAILDDYDSTHRDRIHFAAAPGTDMEPVKLDTDGDGIGDLPQDRRYWLQSSGGTSFNLMRKIGGSGYSGGNVLASGVTELILTFRDSAGNQTNLAKSTARVDTELTIRQGSNWSTLRSTVKLRNYAGS